ncbi:hypothetical protein ACQJBY_026938 [Aegilops geniculata]
MALATALLLPHPESLLPRPWRVLHTRATTGNPTTGSSAKELAPGRALQHRRPLSCSCSSTATPPSVGRPWPWSFMLQLRPSLLKSLFLCIIHAPGPAVLAQVPFPLFLQIPSHHPSASSCRPRRRSPLVGDMQTAVAAAEPPRRAAAPPHNNGVAGVALQRQLHGPRGHLPVQRSR